MRVNGTHTPQTETRVIPRIRKIKRIKFKAAGGNRTRVSCVSGGHCHHYTTESHQEKVQSNQQFAVRIDLADVATRAFLDYCQTLILNTDAKVSNIASFFI